MDRLVWPNSTRTCEQAPKDTNQGWDFCVFFCIFFTFGGTKFCFVFFVSRRHKKNRMFLAEIYNFSLNFVVKTLFSFFAKTQIFNLIKHNMRKNRQWCEIGKHLLIKTFKTRQIQLSEILCFLFCVHKKYFLCFFVWTQILCLEIVLCPSPDTNVKLGSFTINLELSFQEYEENSRKNTAQTPQHLR